jgi:hypothetical protein
MEQNLDLAGQIITSTLARYRAGEIARVGLLQTIDREADTAAQDDGGGGGGGFGGDEAGAAFVPRFEQFTNRLRLGA